MRLKPSKSHSDWADIESDEPGKSPVWSPHIGYNASQYDVELDNSKYPWGSFITGNNFTVSRIVEYMIRSTVSDMSPTNIIWNSPNGDLFRKIFKIPTITVELHEIL